MEKISSAEPWYESWFNTPFYHILYQKRDETEAAGFLDNLLGYLKPFPSDVFLDLACGKGRHARYLHSKGYPVVGADLSENSILEAAQYEAPGLAFVVHDMREVLAPESFHFIFNLFTSFGYFENERDNLQVLKAVHQMLHPKGVVVIDYLNTPHVIAHLKPYEEKTLEGITFRISKKLEQGFIVKDIRFEHEGRNYHFTEKVQALDLIKFESLLEQAGLTLFAIFGNYDLAGFDYTNSERLILMAQKQ